MVKAFSLPGYTDTGSSDHEKYEDGGKGLEQAAIEVGSYYNLEYERLSNTEILSFLDSNG